MAKTLSDKLFLKPEYSAVVVNCPKEIISEFQSVNKSEKSLSAVYNFILTFYSQRQELEKDVANLKNSLLPNGLLWIAYPKNKALETDLNRDILHEVMKVHGFDGVSLVSLNDTWSAMRFKKR